MPQLITCACGAQRNKTFYRGPRGSKYSVTELAPCYWFIQAGGVPVGKGELGNLHPRCLLAIGMKGCLPTQHQDVFDVEMDVFLEKWAAKYPTVKALMDVVPKLSATPWNENFEPINFAPQGLPSAHSDRTMAKILQLAQKMDSSITAIDGAAFDGTYHSLMVSLYRVEPFPFLDQMRGLTQEDRTEQNEANQATKNHVQQLPRTKKSKGREIARQGAKRRRINSEIAQVDTALFEVSDQSFDPTKILARDPNINKYLSDEEKSEEERVRIRHDLGIDENWSPRPGVYNKIQVAMIERQVRGGLISSEAILKQGRAFALHMTLEDPLSSEWKRVNGHPGILLSAQILKERARMFADRALNSMDHCVWFTMAFQSGLHHIRTKNFASGAQIPEGTIIRMALVYPDSIYYDKLKAYGVTVHHGTYTLITNHAMSAILQLGGMVIPDKWVSFPFTSNLTQGDVPEEFTALPYQPPTSITGDITIV